MTTQLPTDRRRSKRRAVAPIGSGQEGLLGRVDWRGGLSPRNIGAVYVLIVICVVFTIWAPSTFPTVATIKQVLDTNALTGLAGLALIVPLATRTFDLSFAYVMSLSGVTAAQLVVNDNTNSGSRSSPGSAWR